MSMHSRFSPAFILLGFRLCAASLALAALLWSLPLLAADYTVSSNADSGAGTLRQAIIDANAGGGGNIYFSISGATITLSSLLPNLTQNVSLINNSGGAVTVLLPDNGTNGSLLNSSSLLNFGGSNSLTLQANGDSFLGCVQSGSDLNISSIGALVTLKTYSPNNPLAWTLYSGGNINISGGLAGSIQSSTGGNRGAYAIYSEGNTTVNGGFSGSLTASNASSGYAEGFSVSKTLTITGGFSGSIVCTSGSGVVMGISANAVSISGGGNGSIKATTSGLYAAIGISSSTSITITNGFSSLIVAKNSANGSAMGLAAGGGISVSGGIASYIEANAGTSGFSYGIEGSSISVSGGISATIIAISGSSGSSYGLYSTNTGGINGGNAAA